MHYFGYVTEGSFRGRGNQYILVGQALVLQTAKFCKQRLKYSRHNSFSTSSFQMSENKVLNV